MKKVAILTSGGDAPGMNNAVIAVINSAFSNDMIPYVVYGGFKGLVEGEIKKVEHSNLKAIKQNISRGGTFIYSARLPEFKEEKVREIAVKNLKEKEIEALVVIGGDGSYMGAAKLTKMGIKTIGLPGTIDNDIASSDYTIGYFTALQSITNAIEQIRDTAESHNRCIVVEVMGRYCGDLAINAAIATGVEVLSVPEKYLEEEEIISQVKLRREKHNDRSIIVLVTEHQYDVAKLAKKIEATTGIESRSSVLGHLQRGGVPVSMDRVYASRMGNYAIKLLKEGKYSLAVGIIKEKLVSFDILKAVEMKNPSREGLIQIYKESK